MDSEKLVEMVAKSLLDSMESIVDERLYAGGLMADAVLPDLARAAVRIVLEACKDAAECEKTNIQRADNYFLGVNDCATDISNTIQYAISALSPDAKEQG